MLEADSRYTAPPTASSAELLAVHLMMIESWRSRAARGAVGDDGVEEGCIGRKEFHSTAFCISAVADRHAARDARVLKCCA
eukprot:2946481-Prymnesium_polylepis.2